MGILVVIVILGCIVGAIAQSKGRSFFPWFIYGAALFIIAIIHVLVIGSGSHVPGGHRRCPRCAEVVRMEAKVCRFCGARFLSNGQALPPA